MAKKKLIVKTKEAAEPKIKKESLFDLLGEIEGAKRPWLELSEGFHKAYSQFMINRFISSKHMYAPLVALMAQYKVTNEFHYTFMCSFVGRQKHYFDYKSYKNTKEIDELAIYALSRNYQITKREALAYFNDMPDDEIAKLKEKWKDHFESYGKN